MRSGCIKLGIFVVVLSLIIYLVKNRENIYNLISSKIKNKKIFLKIIYIIIFFIILLCLFILVKSCISFNKAINIIEENSNSFSEDDSKIKKEKNIYDELIKKNYEKQKYDDPYILDGFSYVEGTWESGYVIQDEQENQYVWVPCTNKTINECRKLQRANGTALPFINYTSCYNESYEEFLKSALENGGFYISRYEIGNEENRPVSKANVELIANLTRQEAQELVSQMYNNVNCEIINGYAYDTTLKWIKDCSTQKISGDVVEIKKDEKIFTGRRMNNNIYDFCDNILEYSLENLYDTIIVRGFMNSDSIEYTNSLFSKESRYCMPVEDSKFGGVTPVAIRAILYK